MEPQALRVLLLANAGLDLFIWLLPGLVFRGVFRKGRGSDPLFQAACGWGGQPPPPSRGCRVRRITHPSAAAAFLVHGIIRAAPYFAPDEPSMWRLAQISYTLEGLQFTSYVLQGVAKFGAAGAMCCAPLLAVLIQGSVFGM